MANKRFTAAEFEKRYCIAELERQCSTLKETNEAALESLTELKKKPDLTEYENLLNEVIKESDTIKQGISDMAAQLYSSNGDLSNSITTPLVQLQDLSHAIKTYLSIAAGKKRS